MIRIDLYAVLGSTVVTVSHLNLDADHPEQAPQKVSLAYVKFDQPIAHDETRVIQEMVTAAVALAEEEAGSLGGFSALT